MKIKKKDLTKIVKALEAVFWAHGPDGEYLIDPLSKLNDQMADALETAYEVGR